MDETPVYSDRRRQGQYPLKVEKNTELYITGH